MFAVNVHKTKKYVYKCFYFENEEWLSHECSESSLFKGEMVYFYPWLSMCGSFGCGLNAMATFHASYFCYKKLVGLDLTRGFKFLEDYSPKVGIIIDSSFVYNKQAKPY